MVTRCKTLNIAEDKDAEIDSNTYEIGYNGDKWYRLSYQFDESKMSFNEYYKIITKLLEKLKDKAQEKRIIS